MKDKLEKTWGYHVSIGDSFFHLKKIYWKVRYLINRIEGKLNDELDPDWLKDQKRLHKNYDL